MTSTWPPPKPPSSPSAPFPSSPTSQPAFVGGSVTQVWLGSTCVCGRVGYAGLVGATCVCGRVGYAGLVGFILRVWAGRFAGLVGFILRVWAGRLRRFDPDVEWLVGLHRRSSLRVDESRSPRNSALARQEHETRGSARISGGRALLLRATTKRRRTRRSYRAHWKAPDHCHRRRGRRLSEHRSVLRADARPTTACFVRLPSLLLRRVTEVALASPELPRPSVGFFRCSAGTCHSVRRCRRSGGRPHGHR